jgi:hypothetical protein
LTFASGQSSPANVTVADGHAVGTIVDDDAPPRISIGDVRQAGTVLLKLRPGRRTTRLLRAVRRQSRPRLSAVLTFISTGGRRERTPRQVRLRR